jgi:hypothetical protein
MAVNHVILATRNTGLLATAAIFSAAVAATAANPNNDYITPRLTFSPDHRYGVMLPVFHIDSDDPDSRVNKVVNLASGHVVALIHAVPGYDRALNFHETAPPLWSADSSILLWKVNGKWCPDALVLLKVEKGKQKWQLDLLKTAEQSILTRTKSAAPQKYAAAKEANIGNGWLSRMDSPWK